MTPLHSLQRDFQSAVLNGNAHFRAQVVGSTAADASQRLDIYARAYRLRLLEALQGDYAKLAILLGDAQFESLALDYIAGHPSQSPSLRWLGRHMAGFLAATPPWSSQPLLAEMAAFEWTQSEVFDAPDDASVGVADIAALPAQSWAGLRLKAHPSLRRLDLVWNVPAIWRALDDGSGPPPASAGQIAQSWLMWRRDLDIHWRPLDAGESRAVDAWRNGACFAEICEGLCEGMDAGQVAGHAALLLKGWVGDGLVSALLGG